MLKVLRLLCGEWVTDGWGQETGDPLGGWCTQAGKTRSWLVIVMAGGKKRNGGILNIVASVLMGRPFCTGQHQVALKHLLSVPLAPHPIFTWGQSPLSLVCFLSDCELSIGYYFAHCCTSATRTVSASGRCLKNVFKICWIGHLLCASPCAKFYVHWFVFYTQQPRMRWLLFHPHYKQGNKDIEGQLPLAHSCNYEMLELWLESRPVGDKDRVWEHPTTACLHLSPGLHIRRVGSLIRSSLN